MQMLLSESGFVGGWVYTVCCQTTDVAAAGCCISQWQTVIKPLFKNTVTLTARGPLT